MPSTKPATAKPATAKPVASVPAVAVATVAPADATAKPVSSLSGFIMRRDTAVLNAVYPAAKIQTRDLDYIAHIAHAALREHGNVHAAVTNDILHTHAKPAVNNRQPQIFFGNNPSAGASDAGGLKRFGAFHGIRTENDAGRPVCIIPELPADTTGFSGDRLTRLNNIKHAITRATEYAKTGRDIGPFPAKA